MKDGLLEKRVRRGFVTVENSVAQDKGLSWAERGMLLFLFSLPDNWQVRKTSINQFSTDGRDSSIKVFNRLIDFGFISVEYDKTTSPPTIKYVLTDERAPIPENQETAKKKRQKTLFSRFPENQLTENQVLLNTIQKNNNNTANDLKKRFPVYKDVAEYNRQNFVIVETGIDTGIIVAESVFIQYLSEVHNESYAGYCRNYPGVLPNVLPTFLKEQHARRFNGWSHLDRAIINALKDFKVTPGQNKGFTPRYEQPEQPKRKQENDATNQVQKAAERFKRTI